MHEEGALIYRAAGLLWQHFVAGGAIGAMHRTHLSCVMYTQKYTCLYRSVEMLQLIHT